MKKTFTSEKMVGKFKRLKLMAIVLLVVGTIITFLSFFRDSNGGTFEAFGGILDNLFLFGGSIYLFFFARKKLKQVSGKQLTFDDDGVLYRSGDEEIVFNRENKPKSIEVKLKTIDIVTQNDRVIVVTLDDFSTDTLTRREIKEGFKKLEEKLVWGGTSS
jgi:hypothetical protein